ncbi:hypothetical protein [Paraglaciecola sp. 25GB23A]|uniref:hypothetical protein n=1 Tax=Paraglaciecola sp. 25GB23A TaxID=3156068 RepID=UPI0032AEEDF0
MMMNDNEMDERKPSRILGENLLSLANPELLKLFNSLIDSHSIIQIVRKLIAEIDSRVKEESDPKKYCLGFDELLVITVLNYEQKLPIELQKTLSLILIEGLTEIIKKKYKVDSFFIKPPVRGRVKNDNLKFKMLRDVFSHLERGIQKMDAFKIVADKNSKSVDTIRRMYERYLKENNTEKYIFAAANDPIW